MEGVLLKGKYMHVAFGLWFACGEPPLRSVLVMATPNDARISVGTTEGTGALLLAVPTGLQYVSVKREGYFPVETMFVVPPLGVLSAQVQLDPKPLDVDISAEPEAEIVLTQQGEIVYQGRTPYAGTLPAGLLQISVSAPDHERIEQTLPLDRPLTRRYFLDLEGQILDKVVRFRTAHLPKGLAITADNEEIWVASLGGTGVRVHALQTGETLADINLPDAGAVEVLIDDLSGKVYATQMETARVYEIDRETRAVTRTFHTGSTFTKVPVLSPDRRTLFVSNWHGDEVTEIDLVAGRVVRNIPTLHTPRGLVSLEGVVYVASYGGGGLGVIDLSTGKTEVVAKGSGALRSILFDPATKRIYGTDQAKDKLFVYDLDLPDEGLVALADTDPKPNTLDMTPDGRLLLVSNRGADGPGGYLTVGNQRGSMLAIDASSGAILDSVAGGMQCTALDVSPDGHYVAFSDFRDDQIQVFALPPYEVLAAGGGGRSPKHADDLLDLDFPGKLDRYE